MVEAIVTSAACNRLSKATEEQWERDWQCSLFSYTYFPLKAGAPVLSKDFNLTDFLRRGPAYVWNFY
jgi:hypothetical protein